MVKQVSKNYYGYWLAMCGGHTGHGPNTSYRGPFIRSCSPTHVRRDLHDRGEQREVAAPLCIQRAVGLFGAGSSDSFCGQNKRVTA